MDRKDRVLYKFKGGFNCAEAIISEYCEELELQYDTTLRIFKGLGGGMGVGEICGALSAGILIAGMRENAKGKNKGKELRDAFLMKHKCLKCKELLKWDVTTEEGYEKVLEYGGFQTVCPTVVEDVVQLLEEKTM